MSRTGRGWLQTSPTIGIVVSLAVILAQNLKSSQIKPATRRQTSPDR
jgi:hypothetical protein